MSIPIDDEKIYNLYTEGKLKTFATAAAIGAASLMGTPQTTSAEPPSISQQARTLSSNSIVSLWSKYYQTSKDPDKEQRAKDVIQYGVDVPSNAMKSIGVAVDIFGGDEGVSPKTLTKLLSYTGAIESNYTTKVQINGPARGYWQVEPQTAVDSLINSREYFGNKFKKRFGKKAQYLLTQIRVNNKPTQDIVAKIILDDDDLAACFSAVKWIASTKKHGVLRRY